MTFEEDYEMCMREYDSEPTLERVETVSQLRHYLNCTDDTYGLANKFNTKPKRIWGIYENFRGSISVQYLVDNYEKAINEKRKADKKREEAQQKNEELIEIMEEKRETFCGVGTRKTKLFLNKQILKDDELARAFRLALEAEDKNIQAKKTIEKYRGNRYIYAYEYSDKMYKEKQNYILVLCDLCKEQGYTYGYQENEDGFPNSIVYFELPNTEQISFHCDLTDEQIASIPHYDREWDGKINSSIGKLEEGILKTYGEIK